MKSLNRFVIFTLLCFSLEALAILPEGYDFKSRATSVWTEVKETVTEKVSQWWNEIKGEEPPKKETQVAEPSQPTQPSSSVVSTETPSAPIEYAQPVIEAAESDSTLKDVKSVKSEIQKKSAFDVSEKGRPADPKLKVSSKGIPYLSQKELSNIKSIPILDVGREDRISKADFTLAKLSWSAQSPKTLEPLPSAELIRREDLEKSLGGKMLVAGGERKLLPKFKPVSQTFTLAQAKDFSWPATDPKEIKEKPYNPLSEEEQQMVAALILFSKGTHCHMVMGLMSELAKKDSTKYEALYHLGACADQLKMNEAAFKALAKILQSSKVEEYASEALELLAIGLHKDTEKDFYEVVKKINNLDQILTEKSKGPVYYRMAKGAFKSKHFNRTWQHATKVPESSDYWADAQLLASIGYFNANKKKLAIDKLASLEQDLDKKGYRDTNIKALVKTNLARMKFLHGNIDESVPLYLSVPKDHGLWVQALVEQGWAQLYMDDYAGAIGNMYSLHSPYFKIVYQPESFVVRTIGYLNICQYGDAYRTLTQLEKDYRDWSNSLNAYMTPSRRPAQVYETVKTYVSGKSTDDVENVPHQVLREAARNKDFLNTQSAINEKSDELARYEGVNREIKKEKASIRDRSVKAKKRFDEHRKNIKLAMTTKEKASKLEEFKKLFKFEKELIIGLRFQLAILEQSRQGYLDFQKISQNEVESTKSELKGLAGDQLVDRFKDMKSQMSRVLDNNEFLRYEVFSGSGENIRYQVSGGKVSNETRIPASIKPEKSLNWSFQGEFWEDEIGNYRSSLRNNCPQEQAMLSQGDGQ